MKLGVNLDNKPSGDSCKKAGFSNSTIFATGGCEEKGGYFHMNEPRLISGLFPILALY